MRPVSLAVALCLCAPFAGAQDEKKPPRPAAPAVGEPPVGEAPVQSMTPPVALFHWFVGSPFNNGAYKATELSCSKVHDLNNSMAKARQHMTVYEGHRLPLSFLVSLGANKKLCMNKDGPTIPSDAVLPMPQPHSLHWMRVSRREASDALASYFLAADSEDDPVAQMRKRRSEFFKEALKAVFADDAARTAICRFVDYGANCTSVIGAKSLDDLYENGRKAVAAGRELPVGSVHWGQVQER